MLAPNAKFGASLVYAGSSGLNMIVWVIVALTAVLLIVLTGCFCYRVTFKGESLGALFLTGRTRLSCWLSSSPVNACPRHSPMCTTGILSIQRLVESFVLYDILEQQPSFS